MKLSTIRLITKNVETSDVFLRGVFDFVVVEQEKSFISYRLGNIIVDLILEDDKNPASLGGTIIYFLAESIDMLLEKIKNLGGEVYRGPLVVTEIGKRIIQVKDPTGLVLGFEETL